MSSIKYYFYHISYNKMLLGPVFHYFVEFFLFVVLSYDTLGYIVANNKDKSNSDDYSRLIFTWVFSNILCGASCFLGWAPLSAEVFLLLKIYITLPVLGGANKIKAKLMDENFQASVVARFSGRSSAETKEKKDN